MKITVIGTGAYSLGLAKNIAKNKNNKIILWTENAEFEKEFLATHKIDKIFKDIVFDDNITITTNFEEALADTNLIFIATSVKYFKDVCQNMKPFYRNTPICIASKGIHSESLDTLSVLAKKILKTSNIAVISGPTFAIDLIHNEPTALAVAGLNKKTIALVKKTLENETLKLRISSDIIGVELCGSIKNVIAIASGIIKGLGYSESTQAFLINESLHDIKNIIHALGGKKKTILSYAGIGDLLLTCTSVKSRNFTFGYIIGSTKDPVKIQEYLENNTVEGYYTLISISKLLRKKGIKIPLINLINKIVNGHEDPQKLASFLISKS